MRTPIVFCLLAAVGPVSSGQAPRTVFRDDFSLYKAGSAIEDAWQASGGTAVVGGGMIEANAEGSMLMLPYGAPELGLQVAEATVVARERNGPEGWAAVGITIWADHDNYWRLALVESSSGERYAEMVENCNGTWQAQSVSGLVLPVAVEQGAAKWEYGRPYRLRISLDRTRIVGQVLELTGPALYTKGYELPEAAVAVRSGRIGLTVVGMRAGLDDVAVTTDDPTVPSDAKPSGGKRVAVHGTNARGMLEAVRRAGYVASPISDAQMADRSILSRARYDALILADAAQCPIEARDNVVSFLRSAGHMLVVGGPIFERSARRAEVAWTRSLSSATAIRPIAGLKPNDMAAWLRASDNPRTGTTWRSVEEGPEAAPIAMRIDIGNLTGWDTLGREVVGAFGPDDDLTILWAKGGKRTSALMVEWQEKDGSRWIATLTLSPAWMRYVLSRDDFVYWPDNTSVGRGGTGDRIRLTEVNRFTIGMAQSHVQQPIGPHTIWIAGPATGRMPAGLKRPDTTMPTLELFSPFHKYYRLPSTRPTTAQLRRSAETGHQSGTVVVPIARPRGLAFAGWRKARYMPLDQITDDRGVPRGARVSMLLNLGMPYRGSVWGHIAAPKPGTGVPGLAGEVVSLLKRMSEGVHLSKAGAAQFSYFAGEDVPLGIEAVNVGGAARTVTLRATVFPAGKAAALFTTSKTATIGGQRSSRLHGLWRTSRVSPGVYRAVSEAREAGRLVDRIEQEFTVLADMRAGRGSFVFVREGDFRKPIPGGKDRPWYPYGVNYWQSNVAGADLADYSLHWLDPIYYDPQIVERDLAIYRTLGCTSLSIALASPEHVRQVNDFVFRAARHGMLTNLYIGGAHPFQTDERLFTRLLREGRFAGNPNVWTFDIAWEHHLGLHAERKQWDREWEAWVIERYGTIEHAERNWGFPIPRDSVGTVTNPSDGQLRTDGEWRRMAVAYARCADDVISRRYARVIRRIRTVAPFQLVSARSASQPSWTSWFAYDMLSCGKPFDFSSPEGYGLKPEEAGFSTAYARYAGNGKPVFWAEFGHSIYPYDASGGKGAAQARMHTGFARMILESGASGLASWWSVGGYRLGEKSDYGIVAPDGTPRRSALELAKVAAQVTQPRSTKPPTEWVTVDRDLHPAAYQALYERHKASYVSAVKRGKMVGVRTAGTGTTSANCPLTAVGNVPYDGFNPLKHLNAEFNRVEVLSRTGKWQAVEDGSVVEVASGKPVRARVWVGNLGEAKWLATGDTGQVTLIGDDRSDAARGDRPRLSFSVPLPRSVARYEDVTLREFTITAGIERESEAVLTMEATGRARFGERMRIVLRPVRE